MPAHCHNELIADGFSFRQETYTPVNKEFHSDITYYYIKKYMISGFTISFVENHNMAGGHATCTIQPFNKKNPSQYIPKVEFFFTGITWERVQEIKNKAPSISAFLKKQVLKS